MEGNDNQAGPLGVAKSDSTGNEGLERNPRDVPVNRTRVEGKHRGAEPVRRLKNIH